ncbi:DUF2384 domain-containing protein [Pseudomonas putida]|uniref:MbcA/ParS/Xre antitoxin family protein n=1 Tax=Pseudomonas putida TaxID=303 RepID=UPI000F7A4F38|nr:MbcA/ParS/Xre antitoxin family protein [Pseudomonas putida]RSC25930.1 DUF2384 domain-containing protein [Pseudomonas putida]
MYGPLRNGLIAIYPSLFGNQSLTNDAFVCECLNGWFDLIAANLKLIERYAELERLKVEVVQIKEKFGLLRIYHFGGDLVVDSILDIAELVSGCVCEVCGAQGSVGEHQGWLRTRCHLHREINESDSVINGNNGYIENYVKCVALLLWFFKDNSVSWVNQECLGLGGQRPFELLTSSEGCEQVYMLIRRLESGVVV